MRMSVDALVGNNDICIYENGKKMYLIYLLIIAYVGNTRPLTPITHF